MAESPGHTPVYKWLLAFLGGLASGFAVYGGVQLMLDHKQENPQQPIVLNLERPAQPPRPIQLNLPTTTPQQSQPDDALRLPVPQKDPGAVQITITPQESDAKNGSAPKETQKAQSKIQKATQQDSPATTKAAPDIQMPGPPAKPGLEVVARKPAVKPKLDSTDEPTELARPQLPERPEHPARPDDKARTSILKRLMITSEGGQLASRVVKSEHVQFVGFFPFATQALQINLGENFIGRPIRGDVLKNIRSTLKNHAREAGYPFTRVDIPRQDVTNGVVRIVMRQSTLAAIRVEGNQHYSDQRILDKISLRTGDIIHVDRLDENIKRLNRNPALSARAVFSEGEQPGTTILTLKVRDKPEISTFLAYNNTGTPSTQEQQASLGFTDHDFLGMTTRLDYTHSRSVGNNNLRSHTVALTRRFDSGAALSLDFAYSRTEASILGGALESRGWSRQVTTDYSHPLPDADLPGFESLSLSDQRVTAGLEYKNTQGNVLFTLFGAPVQTGSGSDTEVYNLKLAYKGLITDPYDGKTRLEAKAYASPGDLSEINDDQAFDQARIGAEAQYAYARLEAERRAPVDLPVFKRDARLRMALRGQYSPQRLIGTERFIAGGASRPRGYHASAFSGDYGYVGTLALGLPPYRFRFAGTGENRIRLSAFTDFGMVGNINNRPGEPATEGFGSIGVALDYAIGQAANLQASIAQDIAGVEAEREQTALFRFQTSLDPLYDGR